MKKRSLKFGGLIFASVIIIVSIVYAVNIQPIVTGGPGGLGNYSELDVFQTYKDLMYYLRSNTYYEHGYRGWYETDSVSVVFKQTSAVTPGLFSRDTSNGGETVDYSETNVQVEGVDEPDVVKTDGTYLYIVSDGKLYIVKANPVEDAEVVSIITLEDDVLITNIFVNGDKIIVFGSSSRVPILPMGLELDEDYVCPWWGSVSTTIIKIYDLSDIENPELTKDIEIDGSYFDARMIDGFVYIVATEYTGDIYYTYNGEEIVNIPQVKINDITRRLPADHIYYVNSSEIIDTMTHIVSININEGSVNQKSFLLDSSRTMYVSENNIFLTYTSYEYVETFPTADQRFTQRIETTIIHKVSIDGLDVSYITEGQVPGRILNQFSMDEHNGFFRIATTIGNVWDHDMLSTNNVYILDENLNRVSEIEEIAPGERIYSARFMGEKAYLVTFKKVDPFFTLDLSDPYNPKILGKLKIPGYSDYLHPYDENHIIGIGKNTVEALDSLKESRGIDFAWYQGIKIALFDVSDFENPKEVAKVVIGDRGTDSPALRNHKAFLFDREKELLVIPVSLYEISDEVKEQNDGYTGSIRGEFAFQGAYVYKLSLEDGFELKGRVTHMDEQDFLKSGYYWRSSKDISRSLYIGDVLYTISDNMVKMNSLDDLSELNALHLV